MSYGRGGASAARRVSVLSAYPGMQMNAYPGSQLGVAPIVATVAGKVIGSVIHGSKDGERKAQGDAAFAQRDANRLYELSQGSGSGFGQDYAAALLANLTGQPQVTTGDKGGTPRPAYVSNYPAYVWNSAGTGVTAQKWAAQATTLAPLPAPGTGVPGVQQPVSTVPLPQPPVLMDAGAVVPMIPATQTPDWLKEFLASFASTPGGQTVITQATPAVLNTAKQNAGQRLGAFIVENPSLVIGALGLVVFLTTRRR